MNSIEAYGAEAPRAESANAIVKGSQTTALPVLAGCRHVLASLLFVAAAVSIVAAAQADMIGVASVIDGDTIEIHGRRIRLHGIDAPESSQTCLDAAGRKWRCGQRAALALQDLIGTRTVTCDERDVDRYGRIVGRCLVARSTSTNGSWLRAWCWRTGGTPVTTWPPKRRLAQPAAACGQVSSSHRGSGGVGHD